MAWNEWVVAQSQTYGFDLLIFVVPMFVRTKLEEVERQVLKDRRRFGELYAFAFDFCRETEAQKIIDLQMAVPMLDICLTKKPECRY